MPCCRLTGLPDGSASAALATLKLFGPKYKYVIAGYPPFLKSMVDTADFDWAAYDVSAVVGGESMSEPLRAALNKRFRKTISGSCASGRPLHPAGRTPVPRACPGAALAPGRGSPRAGRARPRRARGRVRLAGQVLAASRDAVRVLETSHPPVYYLPRAAFAERMLVEAPGSSVCEFKGVGRYLDLRVGDAVARRAAWYYPEPWPGYERLRDRVALYPGAMDSCEVDGESVIPQEGGFYGGWITSRVVGPFKGEPGTLGW